MNQNKDKNAPSEPSKQESSPPQEPSLGERVARAQGHVSKTRRRPYSLNHFIKHFYLPALVTGGIALVIILVLSTQRAAEEEDAILVEETGTAERGSSSFLPWTSEPAETELDTVDKSALERLEPEVVRLEEEIEAIEAAGSEDWKSAREAVVQQWNAFAAKFEQLKNDADS